MRQKINPQTSLFTSVTSEPIAKEFQQISKVLDETPELVEIVYRDLCTIPAMAELVRELLSGDYNQ